MKTEHEFSSLLITANGKLILEADQHNEVLGVCEIQGSLDFKLRKTGA